MIIDASISLLTNGDRDVNLYDILTSDESLRSLMDDDCTVPMMMRVLDGGEVAFVDIIFNHDDSNTIFKVSFALPSSLRRKFSRLTCDIYKLRYYVKRMDRATWNRC